MCYGTTYVIPIIAIFFIVNTCYVIFEGAKILKNHELALNKFRWLKTKHQTQANARFACSWLIGIGEPSGMLHEMAPNKLLNPTLTSE